jgi:hypothetical protein
VEWHTLTESDFEIMNLRIKVEICRCLLVATFAGIQPDGKTIYKHTSKDYIQIWPPKAKEDIMLTLKIDPR